MPISSFANENNDQALYEMEVSYRSGCASVSLKPHVCLPDLHAVQTRHGRTRQRVS